MQKKHYFLVAGSVMFRLPSMAEDEMTKIEINGIIHSKKKDLTQVQLEQAQQVLQMHLITKMQTPEQPISPQILDVFVSNIIYLGYMTDAEFAPQQQAPVEQIPQSLQ
jgi:hypothetical protein